jgi:signal transduction histidine kinase
MNDTNKTKAQLIAELNEYREMHENCEHRLKKTTNEQKLLQDLIDKNPLSIQIVDKEGYTILANPAHGKLFLAKPKENFSIFKDSQLIEQGLDEYFDRLKNGKDVDFPDTIYNAHELDPTFPDNPVNIKVLGFPVFDQEDNTKRYVIIHEDITGRKKDEIDLKNLNDKLHSLASHVQYAIEKEKSQIAVELHDQIGQHLTGLKLDLDAIIINKKEDEMVIKIRNIVKRINELINTVENLTSNISPVILKGGSMKSSVDWYLETFQEQTGINIIDDIDYSIQIPEEDAVIIFRILQEAVTNIGRHSRATEAEITVKNINNSFSLFISDNGIGITDDQIHSIKSFGLMVMSERVKALGGTFRISSIKNKGTQIEINIPLKQQKI